jgi:predicted phosphodiesterase
MKIVITADLHYNVKRSRDPARDVIEKIIGCGADVVVLVGDSAGHDIEILSECLHRFDSFDGVKLFVAGNHELWSHQGDSWDRYERRIPEAVEEAGFHNLEESPFVRGEVAVVGSMGWYDYSFRPRDLEIPLRFYEAKIGPGAADRLAEYRYLNAGADDVPEPARRIGARWMDGVYVKLPHTDVEFTDLLAEKLDRQLAALPARVGTVVACVHHLPFLELVRRRGNPSWDFAGAFLGAEKLGEVLLRHPRISHVYCGHSHQQRRIRKEGISCINVGCTYGRKRFEVLEL